MSRSYSQQLYTSYHSTHARLVEPDDRTKLAWFQAYLCDNYLPHLHDRDRTTAELLDIGCNRGHLLAALGALGFQRCSGIDLSPDDIADAQQIAPEAAVECIDAFTYLAGTPGRFDIVIIKAVLEHIPKDQVLQLLELIRRSLRPDGVLLVDVPNMDWLMAQHERYMDFTHEVGFTRESLGQVLRNVFERVEVYPGRLTAPASRRERALRLLRPLVIRGMNLLLQIVAEGAGDVWWHSRSIIAVARA